MYHMIFYIQQLLNQIRIQSANKPRQENIPITHTVPTSHVPQRLPAPPVPVQPPSVALPVAPPIQTTIQQKPFPQTLPQTSVPIRIRLFILRIVVSAF